MGNDTSVLIAGAGPTGLMLACELARRGVAFRLIEASAVPQEGSRGKGLQPRTLEVFDDLGIVERVIAHGRLGMPIRSIAADGTETLNRPQAIEARPDVPYTTSLLTPEWRVEEALRLRLEELGGKVEFGTALVSFEQSGEGVTAVTLKGEASEPVTADWLVGCDGGHSVVRRQAGIVFEGETRDEIRMIVADVEVEGLGREEWCVWTGVEGIVSLCPLPSTNLFQYQGGIAPGQNTELNLANLQSILAQRSGRGDLLLKEMHWVSLWRLNVRLVERYREGRAFLAGDAAHIHSPAGGQGMNTGIQDAHNLGWKLAAVVQGALPELLDSYEAERMPVAAGVLALSNDLLRQSIEKRGMAIRRDKTTMQLGIGYRDSTLARDDRGENAALRAGDRAPDATGLMTVEGERRLFDLIRGGRFTLLNFGPAVIAPTSRLELKLLHVVKEPARAGEVADRDGYLAKAYEASERTLVLIRPDGYIATVSDAGDVEAVSNYLAAI